MGEKSETQKGKYKILAVTGLLAGVCFLTYYFHAILKADTVVTHIFYIPIVLACIWWKRKGLIVAVLSMVFLIFSHIIFLRPDVLAADNYFRALMFLVIAFVVTALSEHIARAKKLLQEGVEDWRCSFDFMGDVMLIIDKDYNIENINDSGMKLLGKSKEQVVGRKCYEVFHRLSAPSKGCPLKKSLKTKEVESIDYFEEDFGRRFSIKCSPIFDEKGKILRFIDLMHDITERKKADEAVLKAQQELLEQQRNEKEHVETELAKVREELVRTTRLAVIGQVSGSIAHDLRNPLGTVRNVAYLLKHHLPSDASKLLEYTDIINQEVLKADQIITDLLEMVGTRPPRKEAVDLSEMVKEVFGLTKRTRQVRCQMSGIPESFRVQADPHQLRQVISNIVDNATDAMKGQGEFFVEATRGPDFDTVVFRDTGPGFSPVVIDNALEPLVTTCAAGTGLGLTICQQVVGKHGGTIEVENTKGGGALVRIKLPCRR